MAEKILFTSLKGGSGVTACCIGIGRALAAAGGRTLVVDGDTLCGGALFAAGISEMQVYSLADYEKGACRAKQTVICHPKEQNLCFMSSLNLADKEIFARAVNEVDGLFDFIVLDRVNIKPDRAVIITEPYAPSLKCADVCRSLLSDGGIKDIGLIVCKLSGAQVLSGEVMTAKQISNLLRLELKGVIPEDLTLSAGGCREQTARAYSLAAEFIAGGRQSLPDVTRPYGGVNGYFKRKLRSRI